MDWISGFHSIHNVLKTAPERVRELHLQRGHLNQRLKKIMVLARTHDITIRRCSPKQLETKVGKSHQGIAARCVNNEIYDEKFLYGLAQVSDSDGLFLMLDGVTDPHNLGSCLRSAACAGVDAVIITKNNSVGITPATIKVASGAAEIVPLVMVTNTSRTIKRMQELGVWVMGASLDAEKNIYDFDCSGAMLLVVGSEGKGMKRSTRSKCDFVGKIPMLGEINSLNVSVAAGVLLFEVVRQRLEQLRTYSR